MSLSGLGAGGQQLVPMRFSSSSVCARSWIRVVPCRARSRSRLLEFFWLIPLRFTRDLVQLSMLNISTSDCQRRGRRRIASDASASMFAPITFAPI